ncbi:MAG: hypothetical protein HYS87_01415 [Candidatus Colwellbacteria bacterium]|nr:hypothetical protein [Candidatus Colwellbacteria bacterium]
MLRRILILSTAFSLVFIANLSSALIQTSHAQVLISNLEIDDSYNYAGLAGTYTVSFTLGTIPLPPTDSITVTFPNSFSFSKDEVEATAFSDNNQLSCTTQPTQRRATCTNNSIANIPSGSNITIYIDEVINPSSAGDYPVTVATTAGGSDTENVTVQNQPPPSNPGSILPPWDCSGIVSCLKSVALFIPRLLVNLVVAILGFIVESLVSILILFAAILIKGAAALSIKLSDPNGPAAIGFNITLGLTNIGFVIAIIAIAFATMLRRENLQIKQALPKLIVIALLINFSWLIATTIIFISNGIGEALLAMVGKTTGTPMSISSIGNFGSTITGALNSIKNFEITKLFGFEIPAIPGLDFMLSILAGLMGVIMRAIFGLIAFFALIATAVMLVIRYVALTFLLILMPLALLANVFPGFSGQWKKWYETFTNWIIFYPAVLLFLAIGLVASDNLIDPQNFDPINNIVGIIAVSGLMIGGLIVAQKLGLTGAESAARIGTFATRRAVGLMGRGVLAPAGRFMGRFGMGAAGGGPGVGPSGPQGPYQMGAPSTRPILMEQRLRGVPQAPEGTAEWFERMERPSTDTMADLYEGGVGAAQPEQPPTPPSPPEAPTTPPAEAQSRPGRLRRMAAGLGRGLEVAGNYAKFYGEETGISKKKPVKERILDTINKGLGNVKPLKDFALPKTVSGKRAEDYVASLGEKMVKIEDNINKTLRELEKLKDPAHIAERGFTPEQVQTRKDVLEIRVKMGETKLDIAKDSFQKAHKAFKEHKPIEFKEEGGGDKK